MESACRRLEPALERQVCAAGGCRSRAGGLVGGARGADRHYRKQKTQV